MDKNDVKRVRGLLNAVRKSFVTTSDPSGKVSLRVRFLMRTCIS